MNKILALLIMLVALYQSFGPLVKVFTKKKIGRKEYKLGFSTQFHHLFSATLLFIIPLMCISNYYSYYPMLPFAFKIAITGLIILCWMCTCICFYLYVNYSKKVLYESLIYDPKLSTIELLTHSSRRIIRLASVRKVEWYSIKNWLKIMPWSNFEYLVLELGNGTKVTITSLIMDPIKLQGELSRLEVGHMKKIIPAVR